MEKIHVIYLQMNESGMAKEDILYFNNHVDVDNFHVLCILKFEE
jgi:hypothetical protein